MIGGFNLFKKDWTGRISLHIMLLFTLYSRITIRFVVMKRQIVLSASIENGLFFNQAVCCFALIVVDFCFSFIRYFIRCYAFLVLFLLRSYLDVQSTLVISTSLISNNRLSRCENLVPVLTWKSNNRYQNIVEKRRNCS